MREPGRGRVIKGMKGRESEKVKGDGRLGRGFEAEDLEGRKRDKGCGGGPVSGLCLIGKERMREPNSYYYGFLGGVAGN